MHFIIGPAAFVLAAIRPRVLARSLNIIVEEVASVGASVCPVELALAVLLAVFVLTLVAGIVRPDLFALSVLFIFLPLAFVARAISVIIDAVAMGFVVLPVAVVDIAIGVNESAASVCLVILPVAFVETAVNPDLNALTIFMALHVPLAFVLGAVVQVLLGLLLALLALDLVVFGAWLVVKLLEALANGHHQVASLNQILVGLGLGSRTVHSSHDAALVAVGHFHLSSRKDTSEA